jgi:hypothetical protein
MSILADIYKEYNKIIMNIRNIFLSNNMEEQLKHIAFMRIHSSYELLGYYLSHYGKQDFIFVMGFLTKAFKSAIDAYFSILGDMMEDNKDFKQAMDKLIEIGLDMPQGYEFAEDEMDKLTAIAGGNYEGIIEIGVKLYKGEVQESYDLLVDKYRELLEYLRGIEKQFTLMHQIAQRQEEADKLYYAKHVYQDIYRSELLMGYLHECLRNYADYRRKHNYIN